MSEVSDKKINELLKIGQTKDSFASKFKALFGVKESESEISIFDDMTSDEDISLIFDTITSASNDGDFGDTISITKKDIDVISKYDGDADSVSEKDIIMYYEDKIKQYQDELSKSDVTDSEIVADGSEKSSAKITSAKALDSLFLIKQMKIMSSTLEKNLIQNQIEDLINSLDEKQKKNAEKINNKIKKIEKKISDKTNELSNNQNERLIIETQIAKKEAALESTQDENLKETLSDELKNLRSDLAKKTKNESKIGKEISNLEKDKQSLIKELMSICKDSKISNELQSKYDELTQIDRRLEKSLSDIDSQVQEYQQQLILTARAAGAQSAMYSNIANGYVDDGTVGKTAAQALSRAVGEIGVREATGHNDGAAVAKYRGGSDNHAHWCASFVSWCYKGRIKYQASVSELRNDAIKEGTYVPVKAEQRFDGKDTTYGRAYVNKNLNCEYRPKPGDIMIQKSNGASHTGIVEKVDPDGTIHTIEGNSGNMVRRVTYKVGSKGYQQISGYVKMS